MTKGQWMQRTAQLEKVARIVAWLNKDHAIPIAVPKQRGSGEAMPGVMTHGMVSHFEPLSAGHTDPGPNYPLYHVIARANEILEAGGWEKEKQLARH